MNEQDNQNPERNTEPTSTSTSPLDDPEFMSNRIEDVLEIDPLDLTMPTLVQTVKYLRRFREKWAAAQAKKGTSRAKGGVRKKRAKKKKDLTEEQQAEMDSILDGLMG